MEEVNLLKARSLGLRRVRNYATGFHNFYKIVPLRSVFAPVEFSSKTLTSPINCYKQIQNLSRFGFVLRTAYAFLLTIRRSGFSSKEDPPLYGSTTFRLQEELLNGQCPGERTDRAGLCKAHKARLCELGANPRQPTTNPLPQAEKIKYV